MNDSPPISVNITDLDSGWATLTLVAGRKQIQVACSNVIDSLGDLLRGLGGLSERAGKFEVQFMTENRGAYLLSIRRDGEALEVVVKKAMNDFDNEHIEPGRQSRARLRWRGPFRVGASAFIAPFERLWHEVGPDRYKERWWHPFPEAALQKLEKVL